MSKSRKRRESSPNNASGRSHNRTGSSRRDFLRTAAGVAASTALSRTLLGAQGPYAIGTNRTHPVPPINQKLLMTPAQALEWAKFKAEGGPTYAGSAGWKRFNDFLVSKSRSSALVDIESVDVSYDQYVVDDWPDRRTHIYNSGIAVEKLVTDGTPVPVVASYGMTSGSTPPEGITAPMVYYDPANPRQRRRSQERFSSLKRRNTRSRRTTTLLRHGYTLTDYQWRSPGQMAPTLHAAADERDERVSFPLGLGSGGTVRPDRSQSQSGRAWSSSTTCRRERRSA